MAIVLAPDAEDIIIGYLRAALAGRGETYAAGVGVSNKLPPAQTPVRYIQVLRIGGPMRDLVIDQPLLIFQVWHADDAQTMACAQLARGLILALRGTSQNGVTIGGIAEFQGPTRVPDPVNNSRRVVQFTHQISLRGVAA